MVQASLRTYTIPTICIMEFDADGVEGKASSHNVIAVQNIIDPPHIKNYNTHQWRCDWHDSVLIYAIL